MQVQTKQKHVLLKYPKYTEIDCRSTSIVVGRTVCTIFSVIRGQIAQARRLRLTETVLSGSCLSLWIIFPWIRPVPSSAAGRTTQTLYGTKTLYFFSLRRNKSAVIHHQRRCWSSSTLDPLLDSP
jgi:hypothetical protein